MGLRLSLLALIAAFTGCAVDAPFLVRPAEPEPKQEQPGIVYLVSGIGGFSPLGRAGKFALPLAGVQHEVRDFAWQHGKGNFLRDLQDADYLKKKAEELAQEIRVLHGREPERRIYLVGHSAGAALIVQTAEMLPPKTLERLILLSSALSPDYDLSLAFRATRGEIVTFYSQLDRVVLHWGTGRFGTADRIYGPAAGLSGFVAPAHLDEASQQAYRRLVQVPWTLDKTLELQGGWHHSTTMPLFLARQVAPWLKTGYPEADKMP